MFARRTLLAAGSALLAAGSALFAAGSALTVASCSSKPAFASAETPEAGVSASDADARPAKVVKRPIERYRVDASVEGLGDLLDATAKVQGWVPDGEPIHPRADLEAALLGIGFGPGFLANLDLDGLHAAVFEYPHTGQAAAASDNRLAGVVSVKDARKVIQNMPASMRPQPLGGGLWELMADSVRYLMREQAQWIEFGMVQEDLDRAAQIPASVGTGRRVRLAASNIPADDLDPGELFGLDRSTKLGRQLSEIAQGLNSIRVELDLGTQRDFQLFGSVEAPFEMLGLEPLGPPRTNPTSLEGRLPADPAVVATLSFGDPKLLHDVLERNIPLDKITRSLPGDLANLAKRAMNHIHETLDQVTHDVVAAVYLTPKGTAALVIAAGIKDDGKGRAAVRGINEVLHDALKVQARLEGADNPDRMSVIFKPDGLRFTGASADHFVVSLPKRVQDDARALGPFLASKARLDVVSFVEKGTAVVAIGAGARKIAAEVARNITKPGRKTLGTDRGLEAVRSGFAGCQLCITADPVELLRLRFLTLQATQEDTAARKEIKQALAKLRKLHLAGGPGFGITVVAGRATAALAIPRSLLFAPKDEAQTVVNLVELAGRDGQPEEP